ncbi:hypothetical protein BSG1_21515 [Bacillus sp. SG-1]|nr:hypothetical protein BSG1_21515 [Bacillus sp. SG-1]
MLTLVLCPLHEAISSHFKRRNGLIHSTPIRLIQVLAIPLHIKRLSPITEKAFFTHFY